jgi:hypothetical protein
MRWIVTVPILAFVVAGFAQESSGPRNELLVDLVPFRDLPAIERSERPVRGVMIGGGKPRAELSAQLLPLELSEFAWGDHFEFSLRVENVGTIPVSLPTAADGMVPEESDHTTAHVFRALASMELESSDGKRRLGSLEGFALAGAATTPGSLQRLLPGQAAVFRVPAQWSSGDGSLVDALRREPQREVRVRGALALFDATASVSSVNAQTVVLTLR